MRNKNFASNFALLLTFEKSSEQDEKHINNSSTRRTPASRATQGRTPASRATQGRTPASRATQGRTPASRATQGRTPASRITNLNQEDENSIGDLRPIIDFLRYKQYKNRESCSLYLEKATKDKLDVITKHLTSDLRAMGLYGLKKDITRSQIIEMLVDLAYSYSLDTDSNI